MKLQFDAIKRLQTLDARGLDMNRASEILEGSTITFLDERRQYGEERLITFGYLDSRMVVLVWTKRDESCRIISLRKANGREQALYGPRLGRS